MAPCKAAIAPLKRCSHAARFETLQAQQAARDWYHAAVRIERGLDPANNGAYTVADAMADYLAHYRIEGKGLSTATAIINAHILQELGAVKLDRLTTRRIADWHKALAARPARLRTAKASGKRNTRAVSQDPEITRQRSARRIPLHKLARLSVRCV